MAAISCLVTGMVPLTASAVRMAPRTPTTNDAEAIAVIYPEIGEPYRSVFSTIIEGVEAKAQRKIASYPVRADVNAEHIAGELKKKNIKVVIALGRNGIKVASTLQRHINVVAGGVIWAPETKVRAVSIISLAPDPALMFARLKDLAPAARRVFVVYDPKQNAWLARLAQEAAQNQEIELVAYQASDLRTAMQHYQKILAIANPKRDALWLPQDSTTVDESSVLPLVLENAWSRSLAVFSSNVTHVNRGVLFALYPNNIELGRNLAEVALGRIGTGPQDAHSIVPLRSVLLAVNLRTAAHLGLKLSSEQTRRIDLTFPQP
jgi:putative ABC transport system substrate-binding protein